MPTGDVPETVQRFLLQHVESFEQLEILMRLRAQQPTSSSAATLSEKLGLSLEFTAEALTALIAQGLVQRHEAEAGFRFAPTSKLLKEAADELAECYGRHRLEIVKLINANAIKRMRTSALRAFADAFVLRKDDK